MFKNSKSIIALLIIVTTIQMESRAQRSIIRNQIRNNIEKKQEAEHKEKGVKAIEDITYENDTRYKDFKGNSQATFEFLDIDFDKKGQEKRRRTDKIIFGKLGECMAMDIGTKDEMWMIANYKDKAHYMVNVKEKSAMKMPLMNFKKMAERTAKQQEYAQEKGDASTGKWSATNETEKINGYNCKKYIYTYAEGSNYSAFEAWVTKEINVVVDNNYIMGTNIGNLKNNAAKDANVPMGFIVLSKMYNKKNVIVSERQLTKAQKITEEKYFDLSPFKINDMIDALR